MFHASPPNRLLPFFSLALWLWVGGCHRCCPTLPLLTVQVFPSKVLKFVIELECGTFLLYVVWTTRCSGMVLQHLHFFLQLFFSPHVFGKAAVLGQAAGRGHCQLAAAAVGNFYNPQHQFVACGHAQPHKNFMTNLSQHSI